jgi:hypothetical protein
MISQRRNYLWRSVAGHVAGDNRWRFCMKKIILAAFTVLSLTAAIAPMANATSMYSSSAANNPTAGGGG